PSVLAVGTGGGCGEGWGPCACPGGHTMRWDSATQTDRTPTRTGTRPPHPPNPAPCPYRWRTIGSYDSRFWSLSFIIAQLHTSRTSFFPTNFSYTLHAASSFRPVLDKV